MASSSKQSSLFGLQDWKKIYQPYSSADIQSYDYESIRKNFIDYLTRKYPETFNDYIESSEFVALLDVIAYMGQGLAFRGDLNARENFIDTAQRRDSVIKLANLVAYNPKRNIAGQGLVKITAISTTENVYDLSGQNLSGQTILWNDPANSTWQEQFNSIINASLLNNQRIGKPGNSQMLLDIKTDEYTINLPTGQLPVSKFQTTVNGNDMSFELVSVTSMNQDFLYELPPAPSNQFNILYRNDKLGYGSGNTGFFFYFKQGSLQSTTFSFAQQIENNTHAIDIEGINNADTWLYKLDSNGQISSLWTQVDSVYTSAATNQGTSSKDIYSVTSRTNDKVTYIFSDGIFGNIPVGSFRAYVRSSNALRYIINPSEMDGIQVTMNYVSRSGNTETLTFTISLQSPVTSAQTRETLTSIKERAPARYYTQNRMVNGEDYSNFPFTLYNSIIKSKAINRTSIGVSRNLDLLDPTGKFSSTNVFAHDGAVTFDNTPFSTSFSTVDLNYATEFLSSTLPVLLSDTAAIHYYQTYYSKKDATTGNNSWRWHLSSISGSQVTGYFYQSTTGQEIPMPIGSYSSENLKYLSQGAQVKLRPVQTLGMPTVYFDDNNRLTTVNTGKNYIWVGVDAVVGDGYNFGTGNLSSGLGPVTLSGYVPGGINVGQVEIAGVGSIIPAFATQIGATNINLALAKIKVQQDFALAFDDTKVSITDKWSIIDIPAEDTYTGYFISFVHSTTDSKYTVTIKNAKYLFSSINNVRFLFDDTNRVYDPKTGLVLKDTITVLSNYNQSAATVTPDLSLNVVGQPVLSDGYSDDFQVSVSPIDVNTGYSLNPDFFREIIGDFTLTNRVPTATIVSPSSSVFFEVGEDSDGLMTTAALAAGTVIYNTTLNKLELINNVVYEYPESTVFFCTDALSITSLTATKLAGYNSTYKVLATCGIDHKLKSGMTITITNAGSSTSPSTFPYNGKFTISVPSNSTTTFNFTVESTVALTESTTAKIVNRYYQSSIIPGSTPVVLEFSDVTSSYYVKPGRSNLPFQYRHNTGESTRIDPASTNIIDLFVVTQSYYTQYSNWVADSTGTVAKPNKPTVNELQQSYGTIDTYKMLSDTVIINSVTFKPLFGTKADLNLQASIKVVKNHQTTVSDSQIRSSVLSAMNTYFALDNWNFGDIFYFSELSAYLHSKLGSIISSVILVPTDPSQKFGDMYEIKCQPDEIFVNGATASDIVVISSLTASNMQR